MKILKKIKHKEFIVDNEYDLDEIIRKYGKTGDEIEEHISGIPNGKKTQIIRNFTRVENLGTREVTKAEYDLNQNDSRYKIINHGNEVNYVLDDYEIEQITQEEYQKEIDSSEYHLFTSLNYDEFINDFDFQAFDSFFENVILQYCLECQISIENVINNSKTIKAKIILQEILTYIINSNDFLENFRFQKDSNEIQKSICRYLIYYNKTLLQNTINKYKLIFPRIINNIPNEVNKVRENKTLEDILSACYNMQENKTYIEDNDENKRTKQVLDLLKIKYTTSDQSQKGKSSTGKKPGSVDGVIIDKDSNEYYIEAINVKCIDKTNITKHINKLESNYDNKGLFIKFLFVYCNIEVGKFDEFSKNYKYFIDKDLIPVYTRIEDSEEILNKHTNSRIFKSSHLREGKKVHLYHILLHFSS